MTAIPVRDVDRARGFYDGVLDSRFAGGPRADGSFEYECGAGIGLFTYPMPPLAGGRDLLVRSVHSASSDGPAAPMYVVDGKPER